MTKKQKNEISMAVWNAKHDFMYYINAYGTVTFANQRRIAKELTKAIEKALSTKVKG